MKISAEGWGGLLGRRKGVTFVVGSVFLGGSPVSMPASPALAPRTLRRPAQAPAAPKKLLRGG